MVPVGRRSGCFCSLNGACRRDQSTPRAPQLRVARRCGLDRDRIVPHWCAVGGSALRGSSVATRLAVAAEPGRVRCRLCHHGLWGCAYVAMGRERGRGAGARSVKRAVASVAAAAAVYDFPVSECRSVAGRPWIDRCIFHHRDCHGPVACGGISCLAFTRRDSESALVHQLDRNRQHL